jgi:hypothetical protein
MVMHSWLSMDTNWFVIDYVLRYNQYVDCLLVELSKNQWVADGGQLGAALSLL